MTAIQYITGDLLKAEQRHIMQGCNAKGVMGSGVAAAIRSRYPQVWTDYSDHARTRGLKLGDLIWSINDPHVVINAITQERYGRDPVRYVSYDAIATAFEALNREAAWSQSSETIAAKRGGPITEVAMPLIGAGLANGSWSIISAIIEKEATAFQPVVYLRDGVMPQS